MSENGGRGMRESNKPAFPKNTPDPFFQGLTKREWLAGLAMQGCLSRFAIYKEDPDDRDGPWRRADEGALAKLAVMHADALIDELEKKKKE
jgi:hypothetical protein